MNLNKRSIFSAVIFILLFFFIVTLKLPYYIYKPGVAEELSRMVEVDYGTHSSGEFHLVTVSGSQASPIDYLVAKFVDFHDISPLEEAIPEDFTDEEYRYYQLKMMKTSKNASKVVAYHEAGKNVTVDWNGVFVVRTMNNMPAKDVLQIGDRIIRVDKLDVKEPADLTEYVQGKSENETVEITFERDGQLLTDTIKLQHFENDSSRVGIGIQLIADRSVKVEPEVKIESGNIGGPSAGLMFALEIYDQLVDEDITKGYKIAGTGEIDFDGNVHRVGGVDKKVIAAHRKDVEIFFVPNEGGNADSNYELAKQTAEKIKTEMKIVPIDTFKEALYYLDQLEPKE